MLGDVVAGRWAPTIAGQIVDEVWRSLPHRFDRVSIGPHVVMPNHVHGLISMEPGTVALGAVIRAFKGASTYRIRTSGYESFGWQRNYHEHVVRNEADLARIEHYIHSNPRTWKDDIFRPLPDPDM